LHRAGAVEQHDQPQRLHLAPAPDQIDGRAAMADVAMDGAPQVEPPPAPPRLLAPHQPRPHAMRKPLGERVGLRDLLGIDDMAHAGTGQPPSRRARGRLLAWPGDPVAAPPVARLDMIGGALRAGSRRALHRRPSPLRYAGCMLRASYAAPLPIGREDLVEA